MHTNDGDASDHPKSLLRRELLLVAIGTIVGFAVLPVPVYFTGVAILGTYDNGSGLLGFYGNLWQDLAAGQLNSWLLVLVPYVALRILWQIRVSPQASSVETPAQKPAPKRRKEPTLG